MSAAAHSMYENESNWRPSRLCRDMRVSTSNDCPTYTTSCSRMRKYMPDALAVGMAASSTSIFECGNSRQASSTRRGTIVTRSGPTGTTRGVYRLAVAAISASRCRAQSRTSCSVSATLERRCPCFWTSARHLPRHCLMYAMREFYQTSTQKITHFTHFPYDAGAVVRQIHRETATFVRNHTESEPGKIPLLYDCGVHTLRTDTTHSMASITKYKDGWRAHVYVNGTRATKVFEKKRDAQAWGFAKESELAARRSRGATFGQAATKYVETVSRDKAPGAAKWESRRLAEMSEFFGEHTRLADIDSTRIGEWRDARLAEVSASTVLRQRALLGNLFSTAAGEWKVIQVNPVLGVRFPEHNPPRHQVWTWQKIKRVLRCKRGGQYGEAIKAFHIALHTGMRLNEIVSARVVGRVAVLERDKSSGKASPPVKVPLARKGAELFAKYGPFQATSEQLSPAFSEVCDDLLIEGLTFHDSRASALTWLSRRMDVMTLARISRHRNLRILMDSYYRETAEQIAARLA